MGYDPDTKVRDILKLKRGSIKTAPLERGSPRWEDILDLTWREIEEGGRQQRAGFRTLKKLLLRKEYDR